MKGLFGVLAFLLAVSEVSSLTQADRNKVVSLHNGYRSNLAKGKVAGAAAAKNMYKMKYDTNLENIAQGWANKCAFKHSGRKGVGENLYVYSAKQTPTAALQGAAALWWSEVKNQKFAANNLVFNDKMASANPAVGHFTQMAWARTTKVGCGVKQCPKIAGTSYTNGMLVVCNYQEQGNYLNKPIYQAGKACTANNQCTLFKNSKCEVKTGLCYV